jgi:hypothetical protein
MVSGILYAAALNLSLAAAFSFAQNPADGWVLMPPGATASSNCIAIGTSIYCLRVAPPPVAETPTSIVPPVSPMQSPHILPTLTSPPLFPSEFFAIGAQYSSKASPHYSGFVAGSWCPASPCKGTYNFNALYLTTNPLGRPVTSIVPGIAQHMREVWRFETFALAGAGLAMTASTTSTGTALTPALSGGVLWVYPLPKGYSIDILTQALAAGGSTNFVLSVGFGWGH